MRAICEINFHFFFNFPKSNFAISMLKLRRLNRRAFDGSVTKGRAKGEPIAIDTMCSERKQSLSGLSGLCAVCVYISRSQRESLCPPDDKLDI